MRQDQIIALEDIYSTGYLVIVFPKLSLRQNALYHNANAGYLLTPVPDNMIQIALFPRMTYRTYYTIVMLYLLYGRWSATDSDKKRVLESCMLLP
jgi:hypothetical protein